MPCLLSEEHIGNQVLSVDDMKRCAVFQVVFNFVLFETFDVVDIFMPAADALWLLICCHQVRDFS